MTHYLFSSHDGYGLGHTRRNALIASAVLADDPSAEITLVTGLAVRPSWSIDSRINMVRVPSLLKDSLGAYRNESMSFDEAIRVREQVFADLVVTIEPDAVVVDRHPFGDLVARVTSDVGTQTLPTGVVPHRSQLLPPPGGNVVTSG